MPLRLAHAWWGIGALMLAIDIALSLAPPGGNAALLPDKLMHFITYFLLAFWFVSLVPRYRLVALAGVIALGGALEVLQGMTPLREPEWLDFFANTAGAVLAFGTVQVMPSNFFGWFERRLSGSRA